MFESVDCWYDDVMILGTSRKLELLQFGLPTDKTEEVFRVDEEVKESLGFRKENILEIGSTSCLELS